MRSNFLTSFLLDFRQNPQNSFFSHFHPKAEHPKNHEKSKIFTKKSIFSGCSCIGGKNQKNLKSPISPFLLTSGLIP